MSFVLWNEPAPASCELALACLRPHDRRRNRARPVFQHLLEATNGPSDLAAVGIAPIRAHAFCSTPRRTLIEGCGTGPNDG